MSRKNPINTAVTTFNATVTKAEKLLKLGLKTASKLTDPTARHLARYRAVLNYRLVTNWAYLNLREAWHTVRDTPYYRTWAMTALATLDQARIPIRLDDRLIVEPM